MTRDAVTVGGDSGIGAAGVSTVTVHNPNAASCGGVWAIDTVVAPPACFVTSTVMSGFRRSRTRRASAG